MSTFKSSLLKLLKIVAVLFVFLLVLPIGLLAFEIVWSQHERATAVTLRCLQDHSTQSISTILEDVHIKAPLSYLGSCSSGAPVTADPLDDPTPAIILIARLPDFKPLTEDEKPQDLWTRDKIQVELTGTPVSRQEKWKREGFLFPTEESILRRAGRTQGYPRVSHQFGMEEYILSEERISYVLEDKDSQTKSVVQCFQEKNRCYVVSPYLLAGLSVNYSYDYSQRVNAIAIQTSLKQFVESLRFEVGR